MGMEKWGRSELLRAQAISNSCCETEGRCSCRDGRSRRGIGGDGLSTEVAGGIWEAGCGVSGASSLLSGRCRHFTEMGQDLFPVWGVEEVGL